MSLENNDRSSRAEELKFYAKIRDENTRKYGTDVNRYGPVILERMYSDRSHFLYELIQNTEDACERAARSGNKRGFYLFFNLFPDRIEIWHNGIPFDKKDVEGICGIVAGTKEEDYSQIGKFGIGFKSVYAYTKSPIIYSKNITGKSYYFQIKDYVHPYAVDKKTDINDIQTLIVIPFNHKTLSQETSYQEISKRIMNLGTKTLLFLNNLQEISWKINEKRGRYKKEILNNGKSKWVKLSYEDETHQRSDEKWLVFDKKIENIEYNAKIEIAFKINEEEKIIPAPYSTLYVYFNTRKETHLNFIIQGPYQTTVGRDNIIVSDWNNKLIEITSNLLEESLDYVKDMGLLDVSFLETLPIDFEYFTQEDVTDEIFFDALYYTTKESLSGPVPYLPKLNGGYLTANNALIGSTEDIRTLLEEKQLKEIFGTEGFNWLDASITRRRTPELRAYLMNELGIREITPEMFARYFTKEFIEQQSDEWVVKFYTFLNNQRALWKPRSRYVDDPGILRSKPILRLENGDHKNPFDENGEAIVFLPTEGHTLPFPTVKKSVVDNSDAREFLENLGLKEPDRVSSIKRHMLPKYRYSKITVDEKENIEDIKIIIDAINNIDKISEKRQFLNQIKDTPILKASNCKNNEGYKKPSQIYLGHEYTNNEDLEIFYTDCNKIWFLSNIYLEEFNINNLVTLGCRKEIQIQYKAPNYQGYVWLTSNYSYYQRALNGFDPDFFILGIDDVLETINYSKALILWRILRKYHQSIYGTIEISTRQDFATASKKKDFSKLGKKLIWNKWVPDSNGVFKKPSEISLSELPDEFTPNSSESKKIAEYLQFKTDIEYEILEQLPDEQKDFFSQAFKWTDEEKEIAMEFIRKIRHERIMKAIPPEQIQEELIKELTTESTNESLDQEEWEWKGLDPEEENEIKENLGKEIPKRYEKLRLIFQEHRIRGTKIRDVIDPKEFLIAEYGGHCQICNTRINIGKDKDPIINIYRLIEKRNRNPAANMEFNILGLCPNCWTRLKYGYSDLSNIFNNAKKVVREEIAAEPVKERMSDGYIVKISVVGEDKELFYTQTHMQSVTHFLTSDFSKK